MVPPRGHQSAGKSQEHSAPEQSTPPPAKANRMITFQACRECRKKRAKVRSIRVHNVRSAQRVVRHSVMVSNHVDAAKPKKTSNASTIPRYANRKRTFSQSSKIYAIDNTLSTSSWLSWLSQGYPTRFWVICTPVTLQGPSCHGSRRLAIQTTQATLRATALCPPFPTSRLAGLALEARQVGAEPARALRMRAATLSPWRNSAMKFNSYPEPIHLNTY